MCRAKQSCGTLKCLLSVGNSFKTWMISVDLRKALRFSLFNRCIPILNRVAKSMEDILRYHKIPFNTLNTLVTRKYRFSKISFKVCYMTRPQWSPFKPLKLLFYYYIWHFINPFPVERVLCGCIKHTVNIIQHRMVKFVFCFVIL